MFPTSSDGTFGVGDVKVEGDVEMEGEVIVKTENGRDSEEEKCVGVKGEEGVYSEEEGQELDVEIKEESICIKEEDNINIKEEVSIEDTINCCVK
jgi:hypothetical protein